MKPLVRWSIGETSNFESIKALKLSICCFRQHYGSTFDYVLCSNLVDKAKLALIESINIDIYQQKWQRDCPICTSLVSGSFWKFCPARLRPEAHELFLDNDLILKRPIKKISLFIESNLTLVCEDKYRFFGRYDHLHGPCSFNSGLVGVPPLYDFAGSMNLFWDGHDNLTNADEQGLITYILTQSDHIKITTEEIGVFHPTKYYDGENWTDYPDLNSYDGLHFVGMNRNANHIAWGMFKSGVYYKYI